MPSLKKYAIVAAAVLAGMVSATPTPMANDEPLVVRAADDNAANAAAKLPPGSTWSPPGTCGTCNPISGLNSCDISTSCINTGSKFHCACRAGFKSGNGNDFRIHMPNYEFLVFVPTGQTCNTLCNNPFGYGPDLCKEVPLLSNAACPP